MPEPSTDPDVPYAQSIAGRAIQAGIMSKAAPEGSLVSKYSLRIPITLFRLLSVLIIPISLF